MDVISLKAASVARLIRTTLSAVQGNRLSPRQMQNLLGIWTWPCLLRRPLLSVFDSVYQIAK